MLLSLLFYGYATGVFSSRKLEKATYDSVAFRYITCDQHPDHDTINQFRKRFLKELQSLFTQILLVARELGVAKVGKVVIDGSKVKANANKHRAVSYKRAGEIEKRLEQEVKELLRQAAEADRGPGVDEGLGRACPATTPPGQSQIGALRIRWTAPHQYRTGTRLERNPETPESH